MKRPLLMKQWGNRAVKLYNNQWMHFGLDYEVFLWKIESYKSMQNFNTYNIWLSRYWLSNSMLAGDFLSVSVLINLVWGCAGFVCGQNWPTAIIPISAERRFNIVEKIYSICFNDDFTEFNCDFSCLIQYRSYTVSNSIISHKETWVVFHAVFRDYGIISKRVYEIIFGIL